MKMDSIVIATSSPKTGESRGKVTTLAPPMNFGGDGRF